MIRAFITTTVLLLLHLTSFAQKTNLILFTEANEKFTLNINGVKQNEVPKSNVKVEGLEANAVQAQVVFEGAIPPLKQLIALEAGREMTFVIKKNNKGSYVFRMISNSDLPVAPVTSGSYTPPAETPASTVQPSATPTTTVTVPSTSVAVNGASVKVNVSAGETATNANVNIQVDGLTPVVTTTQSATISTTQTSSSSNVVSESKEPSQPQPTSTSKNSGCMTAMFATDFERAKKSIEAKSFVEEQMTIAKQVIQANCFSVKQVISLMEIFSYEEGKLNIAKLAYGKTVDKSNYYQVNDGFSYATSVEELNKFIEGN
jgi:hypothetical protein